MSSCLLLLRFGLGVALLEPPPPPLPRRLVTTLLIRRLWDQLRHRHGTAIPIDGDEGEIAGVRVATQTADHVLGLDADADLHRRPADEVDAGLHHDEIP